MLTWTLSKRFTVCRYSSVTEEIQILGDVVRESLRAYDAYFNEIEKEIELRERELDMEMKRAIENKRPESEIARLMNEKRDLRAEIDHIFLSITENFAKAIRETHIPMEILELRISVSIPHRNYMHPNILLKPETSISVLWGTIKENLRKLADPIVNRGDIRFCFAEPAILDNVKKFLDEEPSSRFHLDNIGELIRRGCIVCDVQSPQIIAELGIAQGSRVFLLGEFLMQSEIQPECISYSFEGPVNVDYYSCEDCKVNWVCTNCAKYCHQGHKLVMYMKDHTASSGLCYCYSKNLCKAINKRHKGKQLIPSLIFVLVSVSVCLSHIGVLIYTCIY
eukprot:TRINITY_DN1028_c0_g1_i1.p1 TRINITY_DN1028_c0_g1~~TRINITY_DN1028_c0_g1_i1.p1  ORF type:complete len:336 (-),score=29.44 TRINITY_DN1028_c0_g1_i1:45-1052(-)